MQNSCTLLVVDDEPFNIEILREHLEEHGYNVVTAKNGTEALKIIKSDVYKFDAILLDRMMPETDGIQVLKIIKHDLKYQNLPVIMQSAAAANEEIIEGIEAGAYYYLTKPYIPEVLLSIVEAAVKDHKRITKLSKSAQTFDMGSHLITHIEYEFQTLDEIDTIVASICKLTPNHDRIIVGLTGLMINAVEHGNLDIGYNYKTELLKTHKWSDEINNRLKLLQYKDRKASIMCRKHENILNISIKDDGKGFNHSRYDNINTKLAHDSHGRGIIMARLISFDEVSYNDTGNEVNCILKLT